jgi:hypothetical protein
MTNRTNEWVRKKFIELRLKIPLCSFRFCYREYGLEFAHLEETGLKGRSRGRIERYYDIINNPDKYALLCKIHHLDYDNNRIERKDIHSVEFYLIA